MENVCGQAGGCGNGSLFAIMISAVSLVSHEQLQEIYVKYDRHWEAFTLM